MESALYRNNLVRDHAVFLFINIFVTVWTEKMNGEEDWKREKETRVPRKQRTKGKIVHALERGEKERENGKKCPKLNGKNIHVSVFGGGLFEIQHTTVYLYLVGLNVGFDSKSAKRLPYRERARAREKKPFNLCPTFG